MRIQEISPEAIQVIFELLGSAEYNANDLIDLLENVETSSYFNSEEIALAVHKNFPQIQRNHLEDLTRAFAYLYLCFESLVDKPLTVKRFVEIIASRAEELLEQNIPLESKERVSLALERFLNAETRFGISVKANFLLTRNERNFSRIRIISDLRPMFGGDSVPGNPIAFLIAHSMEINYQKGNNNENILIGLDTEELYEIRDCAERAIIKAQKLKEYIKEVGTTFIDVDRVQEGG